MVDKPINKKKVDESLKTVARDTAIGTAAGIGAGLVFAPLGTIGDYQKIKNTTFMDATKKLWNEGGMARLYRGETAKTITGAGKTGLSLGLFMGLSQFLKDNYDNK